MIKYTLSKNKVEKATFKGEVEIPKEEIQKAKDAAIERLIKNLEVPGFRKGKVPRDVALKNLSESKILEETARDVFTQVILDIIKKEQLQVFGEPSVEPIEITFEKPWKIKVRIPLKPKIKLPDYKKIVQDVKAQAKAQNIWTPGKELDKKQKQAQKDVLLNKILAMLLDKTKLEISDLIVEQEVKKRLASLIDDIRKAGLTLSEYLKARNLEIEDLKEKFRKEIIDTYKIELALEEIANKENIEVKPEELKKILNIDEKKPQVKEKEKMQQLQYYWAAVLRKQKTLEFLLSL